MLEELAVTIAVYYLTNKKTDVQSIIMLGLIASVTFMILDTYMPYVINARTDTGFKIGYGLVGGSTEPDQSSTGQTLYVLKI